MLKQTIAGLVAAGALLSLGATADVRQEPIQPIEPAKIEDPAKVELGKKLWFDPRLSRSGFISCNSCHNLSTGGSDNLPTSIGHNWQQGPINSPTVLNAKYNIAQFWDGRAADLQEQAAGPIANPVEMAFSHDMAVDVIRSIPQYVAEFKAVYGDERVDLERITNAIAAFEETLVTPNSRFDQWLKGDDSALSELELKGYELFKSVGCTACHIGPAVGGTMFQKMGLVKPYETKSDAVGRVAVTGNEAETNFFKVPTLRNVALTYPYFHDGAVWTLEEAVNIMADVQLGRQLKKEETDAIVAFLHTLTGEQPQITLPILPPSNKNTPRPIPFE